MNTFLRNRDKGDGMRYVFMITISVIVISMSVLSASQNGPCQWDQYLGNQQRTAYSRCNGPDSPEVLWEVSLPGYPGTPFITEDKVIVLWNARVAIIDLLTGNVLDEAVADVQYLSGAYPAGDLILGQTGGGWIYRIDPATGEAPFDIRVPDCCFNGRQLYPVILPDRIIFPTTPVVCLSRDDFRVLWNLEESLGELYPENGVTLSIAASEDVVGIVIEKEKERRIYTVEPDSGELIWTSDPVRAWEISMDEDKMFFGGNGLYAVDVHTGELLWHFDSTTVLSNLVVGPDSVYYYDFEFFIYAIEKESGSLKWKTRRDMPRSIEKQFWLTYVVGAGNSIICSDIFNLFSFSAEDGALQWNVEFQDYIDVDWEKPCPALTEGILVVGGKEQSNKLIAFASDPYLFAEQADAFLSENLPEKAINSLRKAAELYEKKGDISRSQEILNRIQELENQPESSTPASPELTALPESPPPQSSWILISAGVISAGILVGILIACYLFKRKKS